MTGVHGHRAIQKRPHLIAGEMQCAREFFMIDLLKATSEIVGRNRGPSLAITRK